MSVSVELTPSVSPENAEEAEKIKEEANNCFRSTQILIFLSNLVMHYDGHESSNTVTWCRFLIATVCKKLLCKTGQWCLYHSNADIDHKQLVCISVVKIHYDLMIIQITKAVSTNNREKESSFLILGRSRLDRRFEIHYFLNIVFLMKQIVLSQARFR
jgi:hypothetical protein